LEELTLVRPHAGAVDLPHQPGVFVDEPRFPEHVGSGVFHLGGNGGVGDGDGPVPRPAMPRWGEHPGWWRWGGVLPASLAAYPS